MKKIGLLFCLAFVFSQLSAQKSFTGIAKYQLLVEGSMDSKKDSMMVIFGNSKIKTIFYYKSEKGEIIRNEYIDDFTNKTTLTIDPQSETYIKSEFKNAIPFSFTNSYSYSAVLNNLCLLYLSDDICKFNADYLKSECLAGIDFRYVGADNYFFYGVQPLIVDNRLVLEYKVFQKNGMVQKVILTDIISNSNTDDYFKLDNFTEKK